MRLVEVCGQPNRPPRKAHEFRGVVPCLRRSNHPEVEVLKLHHYLGPDVNTSVIDAVLDALMENDNCQALYIQNFNEGFRDEQVRACAKREKISAHISSSLR